MAKYFVEYGALQCSAQRLIECETSALAPKKISEAFAREIADALNNREPGASLSYMPSESDLAELEKHAKHMQDHCIYGGGVLLLMVADYRRLLPKRNEGRRMK